MIFYGIACSPALDYCGMHTHNCWEVILNLSGSGTEIVGGEERPFFPGSVTVCAPMVPHTKYCAKGTVWRDTYLRFFDESFHLAQTGFADDAGHTLMTLMDLLQAARAREGGPLCTALTEAVCAFLYESDREKPEDEIVRQVKERISMNFSDAEFTPRQAIRALGYCEDYVRRRFRQVTGMTPTEYLTAQRIRHARMLLSQNEAASMSIREVSLLSGFYDTNYFSRVFRHATGLSPRQYQETEFGRE